MGVSRRTVLGALGLAGLAGCRDRPGTLGSAATDGSATPAPEASGPAPADAPYTGQLTEVLRRGLAPTPENPRHPSYAGAVAWVSVGGVTTARVAVGDALRYTAGPVELAPGKRVAMRTDSVFDLASVTKVYTAILALQLAERGTVDLDAPVSRYLPGFTGAGKAAVTVSMLLTHTSGLPVGPRISGKPDAAARWTAVLATPLVDGAVPGSVYRYSSTGMIVLGRLVEAVTGERLDRVLRANLTDPLGLRDTGYLPAGWLSAPDRAARLAATDARSSRGLLRGVVHDDVCDQLGGVAGHAGIFGTAADLVALGELLLGEGQYRGERLLRPETVRRMLTNANAGKPAVDAERPDRTADHGLGVVLNQPWFMGGLAAPTTFGHTGFTGTSLLVDPRRRLVLVLLTNRAHPNWSWANPDPVRAAVADVLAATT